MEMDKGKYHYDKRGNYKKTLPKGVHLPCKKEAKMLRKLKIQTGMSEEELRDSPKYRKILSESSQRVIDRKNEKLNITKWYNKMVSEYYNHPTK